MRGLVDDFIREYLKKGLIEVGDNDGRLDDLENAANSLATSFAEDRGQVVAFIRSTLVAEVDEDSPALVKLAESIEQSWKTFVSMSADRRIALLAMVGWRAIFIFAEGNAEHQALVWYSSVNAIKRDEVDRCVEPVIPRIENIGRAVEQHACRQWSSKIDKPTKQVRSIAAPEVTNSLKQPLLLATTTVNNAEGAMVEGSNTSTPEETQAWAQHFAATASNAIAIAIKKQQMGLVNAIQNAFNDLRDKFNVIRDEALRSHQAQNRRTELLWLAESKYSPRFACGYDQLDGKLPLVALAVDIAEIVCGPSPQSVEHFLGHQVQHFVNSKDVKIEAFVKELAKADVLDALPVSLTTPPTGVSRFALLEAAGEFRRGNLKATELGEKLGYEKSASMELADLARTLFREIKSQEFAGNDLWQ